MNHHPKDQLQRPETSDKSADFSVRYFEQDGKKRIELPTDEAAATFAERLDGSELKEALRDIEASLGTVEERDAFLAVLREVGGGDINRVESRTDLVKMVERMDSYTESLDAQIRSAGSDLPSDLLEELQKDLLQLPLTDQHDHPSAARIPQIPENTWTINQRKKIKKLNDSLARASLESRRATGLTKKTISAVYKTYHAARIVLARAWARVPVDVWDLLWTVLSADERINIHRLEHISLLSRDMNAAGVTLNPSQQLLTIEAMVVDGWESKAVESWKRCVSSLGDEKSETFQEYWELGVRMFCRMADMDQAERSAAKLLARGTDPRILMPLIRTYSEQDTPGSREQAWDAYRKMQGLLGKDMSLSDYDQVVSYFLASNHTESALQVFVDMMSDGQIDLRKQKYMPSVIANKFFLGKWLKRLIGAGDLDGAFRVVEFMRQRGVEASPIHLNGLIGAWQRSGGAGDLAQADKVAWHMIESRVNFVRLRAGDDVRAPERQALSWPRATLETFCLMAESYRRRDLHARMEALWAAFRDAKISPDAFMMNQLLESHIQAGQHQEAESVYHTLVTQRGVSPDPYTFSALWKTLAINHLHTVAPNELPHEMARTRALFCETAKHASVFEPDGMDGQLGRKILHTFRRIGDHAGLVAALAALKQVFRFSPPEALVMELLLGTTRLLWDSPFHRNRLMLAKRSLDQGLLAAVDSNESRLEGEQRQLALYEFVKSKFWPGGAAVREAAEHMGVHGRLAL